ncbi:leucine-rich repeat-containing protein 74B-like [Gigantopelta aegis]|uniref:leucine-rich repeat-containing protein 74B-like n=1 Tax=Gigantopelta aegis TaxID=1735272 RepID=UPI001B88E377|nr:leucine-rich repeat-containing protein 74B-like [Gigantopelta aegis]
MTTMENTTHGPNSVETFVTSPSQAEKNYNHYDPTRERVPHKVEGEDDAYNNSSTDSSDEYDTDLEVEITGKPSSKTGGETDPDVICRDVYGRWCDKYPSRHKPFPQSHISKSLSEKTLHIKHRSIGGPAMFPISAALTNNFRVQKLDLDGADIKEEGVIYLVKALVDNVTVSHLNLSNNNLEHEGTQWVAYLLTKNNFLKHVNLSGNKIQDRSAYHIATVLEVNKSLDHLDLSHNQLGEQGIKLIAAALAYNSCLKTFRLNWNHIRRQGAVALSQSLKFNDCLRLLDVSWNGFGYEGSLALSKSLKENKTLRELNLSNNRISWHGALLLSRGLKLNVGLHILRIGHNPLTTTGCHDIVNAIAAGSSQIKTLDLEGVPIVAETEILSSFVRLKRDFLLLHGGIVYLPDILGERRERKKDHMEVVMEYIKATLTRPLEMLKNFDKTTSLVISQDEFVARLVKADVPLHKSEMRILANAVADKGRQSKTGSVDYKLVPIIVIINLLTKTTVNLVNFLPEISNSTVFVFIQWFYFHSFEIYKRRIIHSRGRDVA